MDLSAVTDDQLALILLRVPAKDLLQICTQVSKQWNRILTQNYFWRDKIEQEGYSLKKLAGISIESLKLVAIRRAFDRNFIKDSWDLSFQDKRCLKLDPRWNSDGINEPNSDYGGGNEARIEIPPTFFVQPEIPPDFGAPISACLATSYRHFKKRIVIKLADEGLTDEIMDNFRPTIVVSEMVANRLDCGSKYEMKCYLTDEFTPHSRYHRFEDAHSDSDSIKLQFRPWQTESWVKAERIFDKYPPGMRYLMIQCSGSDSQLWGGYYGVKLANCSVKALCKKNTE